MKKQTEYSEGVASISGSTKGVYQAIFAEAYIQSLVAIPLRG